MWNETMQFISSEAITLEIKIAWWSRAIHCDMQPPHKKIPADYDYTRTRPQTAAYSSWVHIYPQWMQIPQRATSLCSCLNTIYILSVFFKHSPLNPHFLHSVTSYHGQHGETQNDLQSFWPLFDSGLVQLVWRWRRHWWGRKWQQRESMLPECMNAVHLLHYLLCLTPFHKSDWWQSSFGHETCKIMHSAKMGK